MGYFLSYEIQSDLYWFLSDASESCRGNFVRLQDLMVPLPSILSTIIACSALRVLNFTPSAVSAQCGPSCAMISFKFIQVIAVTAEMHSGSAFLHCQIVAIADAVAHQIVAGIICQLARFSLV